MPPAARRRLAGRPGRAVRRPRLGDEGLLQRQRPEDRRRQEGDPSHQAHGVVRPRLQGQHRHPRGLPAEVHLRRHQGRAAQGGGRRQVHRRLLELQLESQQEVIRRPLTLAYAHWHARRPHVHDVDGLAILVNAGVFDPVLTKVGAWLAGVAPTLSRPGERWLELGTGSGVVACALARAGTRVVATDIDTEACRNARMNAALNQLDVDVRQGDLFAPIAGERFDGIVANLPFWPGSDSAPIGRAFSAGGDFQLLRRFVAGAPGYAQRAYIVLSEAFGAFPEA
ncbi:MAG: methyltransferase, partial [Deltaproteobacteria bacterium]|nr:methyltransferase [Deltaproteobacteria bacterium]